MKELDVPALRAFRALVEESSVTRAADRLGLSQPAASSVLRRLRAALHDPILIRAAGGSAPTPRALEMLEPVKEILERLERLQEPAFDRQKLGGLRARLSLVGTDYVQQLALPAVLKRLEAQAPDLGLAFRLANKAHLREWLQRGEADLGIGPTIVPTGRLRFRPLFRDRAALIMNRAVASERLTLARYCELSHLVIAPNSPSSRELAFFDQAIEDELARRGLSRRVVLTQQHFLSAPHLVAQSALAATIPSRLLAHLPAQPSVVTRAPPLALPEMTIGMFWHERTHHDPLHRWFRDLVRDALQGL